MVRLELGRTLKNLTQNSEPQRYSWECRRRRTDLSVLVERPDGDVLCVLISESDADDVELIIRV